MNLKDEYSLYTGSTLYVKRIKCDRDYIGYGKCRKLIKNNKFKSFLDVGQIYKMYLLDIVNNASGKMVRNYFSNTDELYKNDFIIKIAFQDNYFKLNIMSYKEIDSQIINSLGYRTFRDLIHGISNLFADYINNEIDVDRLYISTTLNSKYIRTR